MRISGLDITWSTGEQSKLCVDERGAITHSTAPGWVADEAFTGPATTAIRTLTFRRGAFPSVVWRRTTGE